MKSTPIIGRLCIVLAAATTSQTSLADLALAQKSGCTVCHSVDAAIVGPAYKDVAAKYKGDSAALGILTAKVKAGGVGTWGQVPMPPNSFVSDADINTLVNWVLGL